MIIIDYNAIAIAGVVTQKMNIDENMIRHMILNTIRMYNKKHSVKNTVKLLLHVITHHGVKKYSHSIRPLVEKVREESSMDWNEVFRIINQVREEIRDNLPYKVIHVERCEADDIIGAAYSYEV